MGSQVYGKGFFDGRAVGRTAGRQEGATIGVVATVAAIEGVRYLYRKLKDRKQQRATDVEKPGAVPSSSGAAESVKTEMVEESQKGSVSQSSDSP